MPLKWKQTPTALSLLQSSGLRKQWREANPKYAEKNLNIRDMASINELVVLSNMESFNAELIKRQVGKLVIFHKPSLSS